MCSAFLVACRQRQLLPNYNRPIQKQSSDQYDNVESTALAKEDRADNSDVPKIQRESIRGTFRTECLNAHWFGTLTEAKRLIEAWRQEYNESRPHRSLGEGTPSEFASQYAASHDDCNLNQSKTNTRLGTETLGPSTAALH